MGIQSMVELRLRKCLRVLRPTYFVDNYLSTHPICLCGGWHLKGGSESRTVACLMALPYN